MSRLLEKRVTAFRAVTHNGLTMHYADFDTPGEAKEFLDSYEKPKWSEGRIFRVKVIA